MNYEAWENYKGLPSGQEEDFYKIFCKYVNFNKLDYLSSMDHFMPGTDTLASFLEVLEKETDWFNYKQMGEIFQELSLYLLQMYDDEIDSL